MANDSQQSGLSTQERLQRLRARRAGAPHSGDSQIATPVSNEGVHRPRININLSRVVDVVPTIVRFFPLRLFTVLGLSYAWYRLTCYYGADPLAPMGTNAFVEAGLIEAPVVGELDLLMLYIVTFGGLLLIISEICAGILSGLIKRLIIDLVYFFRGSAATREARDRAHANFSLRRLVTETVRGYHSGYSVFGSMARAARGARNSASTLDYGVGAFTGEDPNAPVYDDGLGDRPSQMELTDDAASRIWDLYYPAYGAEGPMSNLHEARRVGPIEPLADDMSRFILRHLSDWSRENAHAYRWRGDWRDADYFDKDRL